MYLFCSLHAKNKKVHIVHKYPMDSLKENEYSKLKGRKTTNRRSMGPKTEKCLHDGANDCKSAGDYGHKDGWCLMEGVGVLLGRYVYLN